jgi:hypothetical protein
MDMKEKAYLYLEDKLLSESRCITYSTDAFLMMESFITDAESLELLKESSISANLITIIIDSNNKKHIGDCVLTRVPNKSYDDLKLYSLKVSIGTLQEMIE